MNYCIVPLDVGHFRALPKSTCMYRMYQGITYEAPCVMWYIRGSKANIIVDLGPSDSETSWKNHKLEIVREKGQTPIEALQSIGLSPSEVKIVIMTHLHWDHCYGGDQFRNARYIVQRSELVYAISPLAAHVVAYDAHLNNPPFFSFFKNIEVITGDEEIEPGIKLIHLPGHSPGSQGILVNTEDGTYLIAGDTIALYENLEYSPPIPSGIFVNLEDYYESFKRIKKETIKSILPGHDMRIFEKKIYP